MCNLLTCLCIMGQAESKSFRARENQLKHFYLLLASQKRNFSSCLQIFSTPICFLLNTNIQRLWKESWQGITLLRVDEIDAFCLWIVSPNNQPGGYNSCLFNPHMSWSHLSLRWFFFQLILVVQMVSLDHCTSFYLFKELGAAHTHCWLHGKIVCFVFLSLWICLEKCLLPWFYWSGSKLP